MKTIEGAVLELINVGYDNMGFGQHEKRVEYIYEE